MDDEVILDAIRDHPDEAAEALVEIQSGETPLTAPAIAVLARRANVSEAKFWLRQLGGLGPVTAFVAALRAHGLALMADVLDDPDGVIATPQLQRFLAQAQAFRCQILKNGAIAGSGVLLGPSLVLTSWHVIAVAPPGQPQDPAPRLQVLLGDGTRLKMTAALFRSECSEQEYLGRAPVRADDMGHRSPPGHDMGGPDQPDRGGLAGCPPAPALPRRPRDVRDLSPEAAAAVLAEHRVPAAFIPPLAVLSSLEGERS